MNFNTAHTPQHGSTRRDTMTTPRHGNAQPVGETATKLIETLVPPTKAKPPLMPITVLNHPWSFQTNHPDQKAALAAVQRFCGDLETQSAARWLTLTGDSGCGKTHLARKAAEYFQKCIMGFVTVNEGKVYRADYRLRTWSKCMAKIYEGEFGSLDELADEYFVVIDDVGAEHDPRKFGVSKLLELLDRRKGKWTILTSNLHLDELGEKLDVRIASRLIRDGSTVVRMTCGDFNLLRTAS